jgi:cytochrome c peroxidase
MFDRFKMEEVQMSYLKLFTKSGTRLAAGIGVFWRVLVVTTVVLAAGGGTVTAPRVPPGFRFELESPPQSLQEVPTWTELEQLLDNPYAMEPTDLRLSEEVSGFPAYTTTIQRRKSFLPAGCDYDAATAPPACDDSLAEQFLIHPLNYNPMTGEELRLLNPNYPGGEFSVPDELVQCGVGNPNVSPFCAVETTANSINGPIISPANDPSRYVWVYETVEISPGCESEAECRVEDTSLDFNSPFRADAETVNNTGSAARYEDLSCMVGTEAMPPEGSVICGADPGEPGYAGFGVLNTEGYSVPAVPGVGAPTDVTTGQMLYDPAGCDDRNEELPGSCIPADDGGGWIVKLLRPTIRNTENGLPDYLQNSAANLVADPAALTTSNENDYYRGNNLTEKLAARDEAAALGKALFWDMQVGSDGVQSCGSCHFVAGADDRTKNQVNPNHIGVPADTNFEIAQPNEEVVATDFPLNPGNDVVVTNDVVSSMGVHFGMFGDISPIGSFIANASGVRALPIDLRSTTLSNVDPIPGFAGTTGNEFRRVEPRNTPTLFNSAFNFDNFWDGRARHDFNGGSVFGAADPQAHVFACNLNSAGTNCNPTSFTATRQIIRNVSLASLATGPGLSEFEMSQQGRNWNKIGKKLLQGGTTGGTADNVTPLANQLVSTSDSLLGKYSNQGGSACTTAIPAAQRSGSWVSGSNPGLAVGKPGLCISYYGLIQRAFYPQLWISNNRHLNGAPSADPFDGYSLTIAPASEGGIDTAAERANTNKFTQMEANFALFWGLSVHAWGSMLIPDDAPFDRFMEVNPDAFKSLGEPNEVGLVNDMLGCDQTGGVQPCYTESGPFKRDPGIPLNLDSTIPGFEGVTTGTRQPGDPDPLLGFDIFHGFNLSGKNPDFLIARCGECHAGGELTDHTMSTSNQLNFGDFVAEFVIPGVEIVVEPLGRNRLISGFSLEGELGENAQDAIERRIINQANYSDPALGGDGLHYPDGSSFFDNGMYNIGVTPCQADYAGNLGAAGCSDLGRGGNDAFGNPLSLARLMLWNLGGVGQVPGTPIGAFDPDLGTTGGMFDETAQDQFINPGHEEEPADPQLPPHLAPFASNVPVGDEVQQDEAGGGGAGMVNTFMEDPLLEGLVDTLGPFNPAGTIGETYNNSPEALMGTWPVVNRVGFMGDFKAAGLRNVELTGPYFHDGGKLTLAQVVDFYSRGGDFATTNATHRDFNIMNLEEDIQAKMTPEQEVALIDYLLTFTDERVRREQAPFDHPEIFVPLDGRAPENTFGRPGFVAGTTGDCLGIAGAGPCFRQIPAVGAAGLPAGGTVDSFMGVTNIRPNQPGFNCSASAGPVSHYCIVIDP